MRWDLLPRVPERVERYVEALFERLQYNVANDLPLTMGSDANAFLVWMGMPPRTEEQERRACWGARSGPEAVRSRERSREHRMMIKLAQAMERAAD